MASLPNFRIETLESPSRATIKLAGELDSGTLGELLERFERVLGASDAGERELVLDLEEVSFIDSSGMRAIIMIERRASERGVWLSITPPPAELTDLLQVTGLSDHVTLAPQDGDAPPMTPFIERIDIELAREPSAPGRARAELRQAIRNGLPDADRATVTLLTSELVTNAVIHPGEAVGGSVGLRITTYPDRVRVEVTDAGPGFDVGNLPPRPREFGGHGLVVVDGLASRWGTSRRTIDGEEGFRVWFELDVEHQPSAALGVAEPAQSSGAAAEG